MHLNKSRSCCLANGLSGRILNRLSIYNSYSKSSGNGSDFIRDTKEASGRVLRLCDFLIKVLDIALFLLNYIFLHLQIF